MTTTTQIGALPKSIDRPMLEPSPVPRGNNWLRRVYEPQTEAVDVYQYLRSLVEGAVSNRRALYTFIHIDRCYRCVRSDVI